MKKIINLINKIYFNTLDIGSHGKNFIFVKNLDQITGFKFDNNSKLPFKNNSIKAIYCSHVIEHLFDDTIKNLLKECYRVLKNGGAFRIVTIDFQKIHKLLVENKTEEILNLAPFRGRPEWKEFGVIFNEVKFVTHFFSNYQNRKYEESPEFGFSKEGFYRGPPLIDDEIVKKMAIKLSTLEFGKWLVSNIPKEFLKNGGHVNPVTIDHINDIEKSFNFTEKQFCISSNKKLINMEHFYNLKRKNISIFLEAYKK